MNVLAPGRLLHFGLRHWPSFLLDLVFLHETGAGLVEILVGNHGLQKRSLPISDKARLTVAKLYLPALGAVLTVFAEKDGGVEKILVRRARLRDDSASAR